MHCVRLKHEAVVYENSDISIQTIIIDGFKRNGTLCLRRCCMANIGLVSRAQLASIRLTRGSSRVSERLYHVASIHTNTHHK